MLVKGWLLMVVAVALAVFFMLFIKNKEGESLKHSYFKRLGVLLLFFLLGWFLLYMTPTAVVVDNNKSFKVMKVIGSTTIQTEWGGVIPMSGLDRSGEYVVNKSLDTLVLFPIIYSKTGYKAYDTSSLTRDVVDIPPCQFQKVEYHVTNFFAFPNDELLKVNRAGKDREYALLTRPQLNLVVNTIVGELVTE